jgi:hypothetical protein
MRIAHIKVGFGIMLILAIIFPGILGCDFPATAKRTGSFLLRPAVKGFCLAQAFIKGNAGGGREVQRPGVG